MLRRGGGGEGCAKNLHCDHGMENVCPQGGSRIVPMHLHFCRQCAAVVPHPTRHTPGDDCAFIRRLLPPLSPALHPLPTNLPGVGCPALQLRLFFIFSRALTAGQSVTAESVARRAHEDLVRWAGRGGLGEQDGGADGSGTGGWVVGHGEDERGTPVMGAAWWCRSVEDGFFRGPALSACLSKRLLPSGLPVGLPACLGCSPALLCSLNMTVRV